MIFCVVRVGVFVVAVVVVGLDGFA